ncbi:MAG: hypothetical protein JWM68_1708, partial [Verrucomicrobiales bacterium]|nr:hypothetical protein [Verrucomicrobiales bacterium]
FCHRKLGYTAKNSKSCEKKVGTPRCTLFPGRVQTGYNAVVPPFLGEILPQSAFYPTFCRGKKVHHRCTLFSGHRKTRYNALYPTFFDGKIENGRCTGVSGREFYGYDAVYLLFPSSEKWVHRCCTRFNPLNIRQNRVEEPVESIFDRKLLVRPRVLHRFPPP